MLALFNTPLLQAELAIAWARPTVLIYDAIASGGKPTMKHVTALVSIVIFLLATSGWHPMQPYRWIDGGGNEWSLPAHCFPIAHIIHQFQDDLALQLWRKASHHYGAGGLATGIKWDVTTVLFRKNL